jgi:hypothetical protein
VTGKTISHYRIPEKLGGGGMGVTSRSSASGEGHALASAVGHPNFSAMPGTDSRFGNGRRRSGPNKRPNGQLLEYLTCRHTSWR